MPEVTILSWRDIPAQVLVGSGRRAARAALSERFEQAIDRCAMKVGARDTDAYLAEWRKTPAGSCEGDPTEAARAEAARIEAEYDAARLRRLIENDGWA
ncbi:MAG: virulence factor [Gemmobacter sp.]